MAIGYTKGRVEYGVSSTFPFGTSVRIYGEFRNSSNVLVSPTVTTLRLKAPDGTEFTPSPTEESTGVFYYETALNQSGRWVYRWSGTGAINVAGEFSFTTDSSQFPGISGTSAALPIASDNRKLLYLSSGVATPATEIWVTGAGTALEVGPSGATAGLIRFPYSVGQAQIQARSVDGLTNRGLLWYNSSDELEVGDAQMTVMNFQLSPSGTFSFYSSAGDQLTINSNVVDAQDNQIKTTGNVAVTATAPTTGKIRLGDTEGGVVFRRTTGPSNVVGLELEDDILYLGGNGFGASLDTLNVNAFYGASGGVFAVSDSTGDQLVVGNGYTAIGSSPTPTGTVRLGNNRGGVQFNDGFGGTLRAVEANGTDLWYGSNDVFSTTLFASSQHSLIIDGTTELSITPGTIDAQDNAIVTTGYVALGANPADTGGVRLSNGAANGIYAESSPAGSDIPLLSLNANEDLSLGDGTLVQDAFIACAVSTRVFIGATEELTISTGLINCQNNEIRTTGFLALGADPADAGGLRMSNGQAAGIYFESSPAGTDASSLWLSSTEELVLGDDTAVAQLSLRSAGYTVIRSASNNELEVSPGLVDALNNEIRTSGVVSVGTGTTNIRSGVAAPESSVTAGPGSLYLRTSGGTGTTLYVKISGTGNTGWAGIF